MHAFHNFVLFKINLSTTQLKLHYFDPQMDFFAWEEQFCYNLVVSLLSNKAKLVSPKYRTLFLYFYGMRNSLPGISQLDFTPHSVLTMGLSTEYRIPVSLSFD